MVINNIKDFCEYFGCESEKHLEHDMYKYTDCGAWITWDDNGFCIGSIVEGSDAEFCRGFTYPVESEIVDAWMKELEELCDEAWNEANDYDDDDDDEEITLKISRIDIKSETFCTPWNGKLYCVDICEDAEERSAWLYNSAYGVKSLMFGCMVNAQSREAFLDMVFSNLPDYIESYAEEYED